MPLADRRYDRSPRLSAAERSALAELSGSRTRWPAELAAAVTRLTEPIDDVLAGSRPRRRGGVATPPVARW